MIMTQKHPHYFKPIPACATHIDVYRVLDLFQVADPCLQHAVKKLLVAGGRGAGKDQARDIQEAIDTLQRWQAMRAEDVPAAPLPYLGDDRRARAEVAEVHWYPDDSGEWVETNGEKPDLPPNSIVRTLGFAERDVKKCNQSHGDIGCWAWGSIAAYKVVRRGE